MTYPDNMRVLALDMATQTGWALLGGGVVTSGSQTFARYAGSKSRPRDHVGEPFAQFHRWLCERLRDDKPGAIAYEGGGFFKSADAAQVCIGLRGVMLMNAAAYRIPAYPYAPAQVKKFWAGRGNADKDDMIAATRTRCPGVDITDSNEADALAILHLYLSSIAQAA